MKYILIFLLSFHYVFAQNITLNLQGGSTGGPESDPVVRAINGVVKSNGTTIAAAVANTDYMSNSGNTTGSAATLTTPRGIYGNNFNGSAALTQIIASTFGGTANGFTKFSGPATSEKTFTLPNSSATIVTIGAMPVAYEVAVSDETTDLTTGTAKITFRMPHAMTLTGVRASINTVSSSGLPTIDINEAGVTILSTKITIDVSEKTSTTAVTAPVISDATLADDAEITVDIDVSGVGSKGLKIILIGTR